MSGSTARKEFRSIKKYDIFTQNIMTEFNSSDNSDLQNARSSNNDSESESHILTQEAVDEQIKNYIGPLTKQLEDLTGLIQGMSRAHQVNLTGLIQGMSRAHQVNFPPTTCANASFSAAGTLSDIM